jgi:hypothetical protein
VAKSITAHHLLSLAGMVREYVRKAQLPRPGVTGSGRARTEADYDGVAEALELADGLEPVLGTGLEPGDAVDWAG